jgi:hypothetical protein
MQPDRDVPIRSERSGNPDLEERLDAFVLGLGERIDLIQEADLLGDLGAAGRGAEELAVEARDLGFPQLERAARQAGLLCRSGDAAGAHKSIVDLTDVVRRVRLGHRGAI